jgi:Flp pilus assembly protein TadG
MLSRPSLMGGASLTRVGRESMPPATDRRGAAAAELAIVMAVLIPAFILAVDAARVYRQYIVLSDAARNGAVYLSDPVAASGSPYADYKAAVLAGATDLPGLSAENITSGSGKDGDGNPYNSVSVSYTFSFLTAWPGLPTTFTLQRTVQMRVAPTLPNFS